MGVLFRLFMTDFIFNGLLELTPKTRFPGCHFVTTRFAVFSWVDEGPTITSHTPGSITRRIARFHIASYAASSLIGTCFVSPGSRCTRAKPFNSFTGRLTLAIFS